MASDSTPTNLKTLETLEEYENFIKEDKLTIVDFWATWCPPCTAIAPWFKEQAQKYPEINFGKVDVDDNNEASEKAEISCMPTFKVFKNNNLINTIEGADKEEIEKMFVLDDTKIEELKEKKEQERIEKEKFDKLLEKIDMVKTEEEFNEVKKSSKLIATNFYVDDYKESVTKLHKDLVTAVNDDGEDNSNFTSETIRRCDLNAHGILGNKLQIRSLPYVVLTKDNEIVATLDDEKDCTLENIKNYFQMTSDELTQKMEALKLEKERLAKLVTQYDEEDKFNELIESRKDNGKVTVVDFYATWCGPCIRFAPTFTKMADEWAEKDVVFCKIDCDKNTGAKTKAEVKCFPTFKIYKEGKIVDTLEGASKEKLEEMINKALA